MFDIDIVRRRHVSLSTQQHRLRHLRGIIARNIDLELMPCKMKENFCLYYTIHLIPSNRLVYTSEQVKNTLNPCWVGFKMSHLSEGTPGSSMSIDVKVWCVSDEDIIPMSKPICIIDWSIHFSGLVFLGEQIPKDGKKFQPNSLIFCMNEGHYGGENCLSFMSISSRMMSEYVIVEANNQRPSYNVSSVSRIDTIQRAIRQTRLSVNKIRDKIQGRLADISSCVNKLVKTDEEVAAIKVSLLKTELETRSLQLQIRKESVANDVNEYQSKCDDLIRRYEELQSSKQQLIDRSRKHAETKEKLLKDNAQIMLRRKELISEVAFVYPIVEIKDKGFKICDVVLPNSEDFAGHNDVALSIALGYIAHLLIMLSKFMNVPLRYPIKHFGSRSSIIDHIASKIPDKDREFPLYCKGKDKLQFTYGVYLLNKNIAQLRHYVRLTTHDLRATLPNLHNLLELRFSPVRPDPYSSIRNSNQPIVALAGGVVTAIQNINSANTVVRSISLISQNSNFNRLNDCYESDRLRQTEAKEKLTKTMNGFDVSPSTGDNTDEVVRPIPSRNNLPSDFSYSLDHGLNTLQLSTSPTCRQPNDKEIDRAKNISNSFDNVSVLGNDTHKGFYKASVHMWMTTNSDDDAASATGNASKNESSSSAITNKEKLPAVADIARSTKDDCDNEHSTSFCDTNDKIMSDVTLDNDITSRVELLASRSGSFKQLQSYCKN